MDPAGREQGPGLSPFLVLAAGIGAVSTGAIFARLADAPALVIAAYRVGLATILLLPWALFTARRELAGLTLRDFRLALVSGCFLAAHFALWISSLNYTSVANSVVLVNTNPLWVGLFAPWVARERVGKTTMAAIALSVVGALIIGSGDFELGGGALVGDILALAGGLCAAGYILMGRSLRRKLSLTPYIVMCYGSAAVVLWGVVVAAGLPVSGFTPGTWGALMAMAVIPQIIGHSSFNWALRWLSAGMIAVSLLGEPIGATILAYFLFGEGLSWSKAAGGAIILGAIWLAARQERKR